VAKSSFRELKLPSYVKKPLPKAGVGEKNIKEIG